MGRLAHRLGSSAALVLLAVGLGGAACSEDKSEPGLSRAETDGAAAVVSVPRDQRPRANLSDGKPGDHIHMAFGIYLCDHFLDPVTDQIPDVLGIHTHGDGVIHVHPFSNDAAGTNARMRVLFAQTEMRVHAGDLQVGDTHVEAGKTRCSGKPADLKLAYWRDGERASGRAPDRVITQRLGDAPLRGELSAYTLAFVAEGTEVPPPPTATTIRELGTADQ